ncbi:unnamed protein product [Prunus brigantina]
MFWLQVDRKLTVAFIKHRHLLVFPVNHGMRCQLEDSVSVGGRAICVYPRILY